LHLRIDNADQRLTPIGRKLGLVSEDRWVRFQKKQEQIVQLRRLLEERIPQDEAQSMGMARDDRPTISTWLRRQEARLSVLDGWLSARVGGAIDPGAAIAVEIEAKYSGYIQQQRKQIDRLRDSEGRTIPSDLAYAQVPGLSREIVEKLQRVRPETLGQAGRIPGVTPAAVAVLDVYLSVSR
jgi:tRNA uridine 5-carboxymethylaminomethyl modification enzyme